MDASATEWDSLSLSLSLLLFSSPQRIEAVFEVNTDLQKNVQAKVTAQLTWPSVVNSSQRITFPLTNTNSSSVSVNQSHPCRPSRAPPTRGGIFLRRRLMFLALSSVCLGRQDEEVVLQNPADVLLYVQVLPLALLPNPSVFSGKLADRWESCRHCFSYYPW